MENQVKYLSNCTTSKRDDLFRPIISEGSAGKFGMSILKLLFWPDSESNPNMLLHRQTFYSLRQFKNCICACFYNKHCFFSVIQTRQNISLSVDADGSVTATFPSSTTLTVSAANFILSVSFTGDADSLRNVSKGLLGNFLQFCIKMYSYTIRYWICFVCCYL